MSTIPQPGPFPARMIPGAREQNNLTYRQSGAMGGPATGSTGIPVGPSSMDAATIAARQREGGGSPRERRQP